MNWLNKLIDRFADWYNSWSAHPQEFTPLQMPPPDPAVLTRLQRIQDVHDALNREAGIPVKHVQKGVDAIHDAYLRSMALEVDASFYAHCQHEYRVTSPIDTIEQCPKCGHRRPCEPQYGAGEWHQSVVPKHYIGDPKIDFRREMYGNWPPDQKAQQLRDLAEDYHIQCEAFDDMACTGKRDGLTVPANQAEHARSNKHAYQLRDDMYSKYVARLDVSSGQWRRAIAESRPRRDHVEPSTSKENE